MKMKADLSLKLCLLILLTMTITQTKSLPIEKNSSQAPPAVTANPSDDNDYYYYTDYTTDRYYSYYSTDYSIDFSTDYYSEYYYDYGTNEPQKEKLVVVIFAFIRNISKYKNITVYNLYQPNQMIHHILDFISFALVSLTDLTQVSCWWRREVRPPPCLCYY